MKYIFKSAIIVCASILFGCATLSPIEPLSARQTASRATETFAGNSGPDGSASLPVASAGQPVRLDLDTCIAIALQNNPEIVAAAWDTEAVRSERDISAARRLPAVGITGGYFHNKNQQRLIPPTSPGQATYFTKDIAAADVIVRLPLYTGGRIVNEIRAAELLALASEHNLARTRDELVYNVTSTFYGILAQRHVVESLQFAREVLSQHLRRVEDLIEAQKAARVDALRTEVRLADLDQQLLQAQNVYEIQHRLLANQMGVKGSSSDEMDLAGELLFAVDGEEHLEEALDRAYGQRSDLVGALAAVEAQAKLVDAARGEREPTVSLEASYGRRWGFGGSGEPFMTGSRSIGVDAAGNPSLIVTEPTGGGSLSSTWGPRGLSALRHARTTTGAADSTADVGRAGVSVDVPIFTGGRIRSQIARERARLAAAQQRLRRLELRVHLETETAVLNVNSARERVGVTQKSIAEAEESLRIEREKYEFGMGAVVDVLDAQSALLNAQTSYYGALADLNVAIGQLALATGESRQ